MKSALTPWRELILMPVDMYDVVMEQDPGEPVDLNALSIEYGYPYIALGDMLDSPSIFLTCTWHPAIGFDVDRDYIAFPGRERESEVTIKDGVDWSGFEEVWAKVQAANVGLLADPTPTPLILLTYNDRDVWEASVEVTALMADLPWIGREVENHLLPEFVYRATAKGIRVEMARR